VKKFFSKFFEPDLSVLEQYVAYFLIYGFVGWLIDSMHGSFVSGYIILGGMFKSFLLPIPFAPIYGFGALLIISVKKLLWNKNPLLLMPVVGAIMTTVEYFGGVITLSVLGHRAWDYSKNFANFHGHIDLYHGVLWMVLGLGFVKLIHPSVEKGVQKLLMAFHSIRNNRVIDKNTKIV